MIDKIAIRNIENGEEQEISSDNPVFVLDSIDWDSPSISMESYRVPFQIGQTLSGVTVGTRKPTVTGYVVADMSKIEALGKTWEEFFNEQEQQIEESKRKLDKLISVYQDVVIKAGEYFLDARPTQPPKYSTERKENNEVMCFFTLEFECYNPLFYSQGKQISLAETEGLFHFPLIIPPEKVVFGRIMKRQSVLIENNGDSKVGCIIVIKAVGGTVENPKIYNVNTNDFISFEDVTLKDGDYITINTEIGEENAVKHSIEDSRDISVIGNITYGSKFLQIEQGASYYAYEVGEAYKNNVDVSIEFTEHYFNIKGM